MADSHWTSSVVILLVSPDGDVVVDVVGDLIQNGEGTCVEKDDTSEREKNKCPIR